MRDATLRTPVTSRLYTIRRSLWPYLFISPFFILFAIFGLFPYVYAFILSFQQWDGIDPPNWVGLDNYRQLLMDSVWWKSLFNTVWLLFATTINLGIALVLAFVLNSGLIRLKSVFRTAYFLPVVASSVAVALIFTTLFARQYGVMNFLIGLFGLGPVDWLGDANWIKPSIATVVIWRLFGWNTVIYLAGLQSIPTELYEAARVDGARWKDIFLHITLPLLRPVITFTAILTIIGGFQLFEEPLMLAGGAAYSGQSPGGTAQAGLTVLVNLYNTAFSYLKFGYAAAMSVALFIAILIFSLAYNRFLGSSGEDAG